MPARQSRQRQRFSSWLLIYGQRKNQLFVKVATISRRYDRDSNWNRVAVSKIDGSDESENALTTLGADSGFVFKSAHTSGSRAYVCVAIDRNHVSELNSARSTQATGKQMTSL